MKRDLDFVREILLAVEQAERPIDERYPFEGRTRQEFCYHVGLMQAHGLVDGRVSASDTKDGKVFTGAVVFGLTWDGCDYLDAIRDEKVWRKARKVIADTVGSVTVGLAKDVAVMVSEQAIRASLGL